LPYAVISPVSSIELIIKGKIDKYDDGGGILPNLSFSVEPAAVNLQVFNLPILI
jgi:hypothetical protein